MLSTTFAVLRPTPGSETRAAREDGTSQYSTNFGGGVLSAVRLHQTVRSARVPAAALGVVGVFDSDEEEEEEEDE